MTSPAVNEPRRSYRAWSPDEEVDAGTPEVFRPQQMLGFVRARAGLVTLMAVLGLAGGIAYQVKRPPVYESTAELIVDPREVQGVAGSAAPRAENADTDAMVGNEMRVLKSNSLLGALIDKEDLVHDPEFMARPSPLAELRRILDQILGHAPASGGVLDVRLQVLARLDTAVAVRRTERSFIVEVSVRTADAAKSARLANALVDLYIAQAATAAADLNRKVGDALQNRLSELGARLRDADDRVEQFRIANHLVSAGGVLTSDQRLRTMTDQLTLAQAREDEDRTKADEIERLHGAAAMAGVPEAVQSPAVAQLKAQLAEAIRRQATLARELGPRHPDMAAAAQQVQTAQRLLEGELQRLGQAARSQYGRSHENAATLREGVDTLSASTLNNSAAVSQLRALEQEAEAARALFTSFLSRSRELNEQTEVFTSNTRQIGTALPALGSATLPGPVVLAASLLLGLGLGVLLAGLLETRTLSGADAGRRLPGR